MSPISATMDRIGLRSTPTDSSSAGAAQVQTTRLANRAPVGGAEGRHHCPPPGVAGAMTLTPRSVNVDHAAPTPLPAASRMPSCPPPMHR